jgi:8-oxo-dGTP pyrophosphatase MutT (NUDIX family)
MIVQRPDEPEWDDLVRVYGTPQCSDRVWNLPRVTCDSEVPSCSGGVILLIFTLAGSCIFVGRDETSEWFLPMGLIQTGEGVVDAARRVAMEEVGVRIEPVGVPLCERVLLSSGPMAISRWYLVVVAETSMSIPPMRKDASVREARPFDLPPPIDDPFMMGWMSELHAAGMRYLRSMDALDGV